MSEETNIYKAEERKQNFGQIENSFVRLVNEANNQEVARFDLGEDYSVETQILCSSSATRSTPLAQIPLWACH